LSDSGKSFEQAYSIPSHRALKRGSKIRGGGSVVRGGDLKSEVGERRSPGIPPI